MYLLFYYLINLLASTVTMQALNSVKKKTLTSTCINVKLRIYFRKNNT